MSANIKHPSQSMLSCHNEMDARDSSHLTIGGCAVLAQSSVTIGYLSTRPLASWFKKGLSRCSPHSICSGFLGSHICFIHIAASAELDCLGSGW